MRRRTIVPCRPTPAPSARRRRRGPAPPRLEVLETRACPSVFYDFDVIASRADLGMTGVEGVLGSSLSINDNGLVSFIANFNDRQELRVGDREDTSRILESVADTPGALGFSTSLNNRDRALVVRTDFAAGTNSLLAFDAGGSSLESTIAVGGPSGDFRSIAPATLPSFNDGGVAAFSAINAAGDSVLAAGAGAPFAEVAITEPFLLPSIANDGRVVVYRPPTAPTPGDPGRITLFGPGLSSPVDLMPPMGNWTRLGNRPSISDDGRVVVFAADRGMGVGIFASVDTGGGARETVRVAGEGGVDLGYDDAGMPLGFSDFGTSEKIGVAFQDLGSPGLDPADSFVVSFIATPTAPGRANPRTGSPFFFTGEEGLWTVRVDVDAKLDGTSGLVFHATGAQAVAQVGDRIDGETIGDIVVADPIANAATDVSSGSRRVQAPGDHRIAFLATIRPPAGSTDFGQLVVRASRLDSDADGLLDHWEGPDGIDIDRDGVRDLDLAAMDANPMRKDLFLEIDWLAPDAGRDFSPKLEALQFLVTAFAAAPVTNPDGSTGITVHIDAGSRRVGRTRLSQNMGSGSLQGGDLIRDPATGAHVEVVYFGPDGSASFPGVVSRSFVSIKDNLFGTADKRARELAFHYAVFADRHSTPTDGSTGVAEIGFYGDLESIPGNDLIVSLRGMGDPADLTVPPSPGTPGVPSTVPPVSLARHPAYLQGQTLMHELGHNLGLRHGGNDNDTSDPVGYPGFFPPFVKEDYRSLMNYLYQLDPDPSGVLVRDYSRTGPVFDDWANLKLDFTRYPDYLGVSSIRGRRGTALDLAPERDLDEVVRVHGPLDDRPPTVAVLGPAAGVAAGSPLVVRVSATDNVAVHRVFVSFDLDGDGDADDPGETVEATPDGPDAFSARFGPVRGAVGPRAIEATAIDRSGFEAVASRSVEVAGPGTRPASAVEGDYDGDGVTDLALYQHDAGRRTAVFSIRLSNGGNPRETTREIPGVESDVIPVAGDFDGDGRADVAVVDPTAAIGDDPTPTASVWIILLSGSGDLRREVPFGAAGVLDRPAPADYDGDGVTDIATFRANSDLVPGAAQWFILPSGPNPNGFETRAGAFSVLFGAAGGVDLPAPADYDGDGRADIATFRPISDLVTGAAQWFILPSGPNPGYRTNFGGFPVTFGAAGNADQPAPADYDGDGRADITAFRSTSDLVPGAAQWFVLPSLGTVPDFGPGFPVTFGRAGEVASAGDFDGDGRPDLAVFSAAEGLWTTRSGTSGADRPVSFGPTDPGAVPVGAPLYFRLLVAAGPPSSSSTAAGTARASSRAGSTAPDGPREVIGPVVVLPTRRRPGPVPEPGGE